MSGERFLLRGRPQRTCRSKMHKKTVIKTSYTIAAAICKCASQGGETHFEVAISILIPRMEIGGTSNFLILCKGEWSYYVHIAPIQCPKKFTLQSVIVHTYTSCKLQVLTDELPSSSFVMFTFASRRTKRFYPLWVWVYMHVLTFITKPFWKCKQINQRLHKSFVPDALFSNMCNSRNNNNVPSRL